MSRTKDDFSEGGQPQGTETSFTVNLSIEELRVLDQIVEETRIDAQAWVRVLLRALVESYQAHGCIRLPLTVVSKGDAERTGLLRPAKPEETQSYKKSLAEASSQNGEWEPMEVSQDSLTEPPAAVTEDQPPVTLPSQDDRRIPIHHRIFGAFTGKLPLKAVQQTMALSRNYAKLPRAIGHLYDHTRCPIQDLVEQLLNNPKYQEDENLALLLQELQAIGACEADSAVDLAPQISVAADPDLEPASEESSPQT